MFLLVACGGPEEGHLLPADPARPIVYVALGDSTAQGVGASHPDASYPSRLHERLREIYPAARLENLGVGGATSADVLREQMPRAVDLGPALVTLSVGPNDITAGVRVDQFEANVDRILAALARTRAVAVVNLLPDLAVTPRFRASRSREAVGQATADYNRALETVARRHRVQLIDLYEPSRDEVPKRPELIAADGYHPSDAGYQRWAELMWTGVRARIPRPGGSGT